MKIDRYRKKKNGMYTIYLEKGFENDFYEEVILECNLLLKKEITEEEWKKASMMNRAYDSYYTALKLLNRMAKSKKEIENYLEQKEFKKDEIKKAVEKLEKQGYLNDLVYAKSYVHNKINCTLYGPYHIKRELEKKGVDFSFIQEALEEYTFEIEKDKIDIIINKAVKSNHNKSQNSLRKKIETNLIMEGFSPSLIREKISSIQVEDEMELARKEYKKLYQKLSKKYSGKELEYKIKQKMYFLGFRDFSFYDIEN